MTRQFCREKLGKTDEIYGEIRHCVTIYLGLGIKLSSRWYISETIKSNFIPFEGVLTLSSKVVNVILEYQLENIVFTDAIGRIRMPDRIAQQG